MASSTPSPSPQVRDGVLKLNPPLPQAQDGTLDALALARVTPSARRFSMPSPLSPARDSVLDTPSPSPFARSDSLAGATRPSAWLRPCTRNPSLFPSLHLNACRPRPRPKHETVLNTLTLVLCELSCFEYLTQSNTMFPSYPLWDWSCNVHVAIRQLKSLACLLSMEQM
jgi:hypothetical protein